MIKVFCCLLYIEVVAMAFARQNCFICEKTLNDGIVIKVRDRGLNNFRQSSMKRKDCKNELFLKNLESVIVHDTCRKQYNNEKLMLAFLQQKDTAIPGISLRSAAFLF